MATCAQIWAEIAHRIEKMSPKRQTNKTNRKTEPQRHPGAIEPGLAGERKAQAVRFI